MHACVPLVRWMLQANINPTAQDDGRTMRNQILEAQKRVFEFERVGYTMRARAELEAEYKVDFNEMAYHLESYVLRDHLADDYYEEIYRDKWPATTWQMFKFTHMLSWWFTWFVVRWPVRFQEKNHLVRVKVGRYVRYPEANIHIKDLGRPFIYELVQREEDDDAGEEDRRAWGRMG